MSYGLNKKVKSEGVSGCIYTHCTEVWEPVWPSLILVVRACFIRNSRELFVLAFNLESQ